MHVPYLFSHRYVCVWWWLHAVAWTCTVSVKIPRMSAMKWCVCLQRGRFKASRDTGRFTFRRERESEWVVMMVMGDNWMSHSNNFLLNLDGFSILMHFTLLSLNIFMCAVTHQHTTFILIFFNHLVLMHPFTHHLFHSFSRSFILSPHILSLTWFLLTHSLINILPSPLTGVFSHPPTPFHFSLSFMGGGVGVQPVYYGVYMCLWTVQFTLLLIELSVLHHYHHSLSPSPLYHFHQYHQCSIATTCINANACKYQNH